jgi:hypothetical protein
LKEWFFNRTCDKDRAELDEILGVYEG